MSVNLYQTGVSGLLAAQQQLATTGNNIANVNTEGYSRQRAEQDASIGQNIGNNYVGTGTFVRDVNRVFSQFTYKEQLSAQSSKGNADSFNLSMSQLNDVLNFTGTAIADSTQQLYQSINSIADNPNDMGLRSIMLTEAGITATNFVSANESFDRLEKSTNGEIEQMATRISEISTEIAQINDSVLKNQKLNNNQGQPNSLLDRRDQLLFELGEFTNVNTVEDQNGIMTVMIGQGTTLVAGITPLTVQVAAGDPDPNKTQLELVGTNNSVQLDASSLGGAIAAKIDFRDNQLGQARREIDRLSMAIADTLNGIQQNGLDLNQSQGANIYNDINADAMQKSRVLNYSANTGSLEAKVNITDISKLPADEFQIKFDGSNYVMTNLSDSSVTTLGAPGSGTYSTGLGFEFIETSGTPTANDTFLIRPNENSSANMVVEMQDGAGIAASSAIMINPSDNNISTGQVNIAQVYDPVNARNSMPMRIDVLENPAGTFTYTYTDKTGTTSAPIAYTPPSQLVDLPPSPATAYFQIEITGNPSGVAPNGPEQFEISDGFGVGNGQNAYDMAKTKDKAILNNGTESFAQSISITAAKVGSSSKSASLVSDTADALFTQAFNRNQEISGVNLDEEAANMLKFQQAYQASSKIISTASTIFDTLLSATR